MCPVSESFDVHLGKLLRRRRRALQLTQRDLAVRLGVRFQQIQKYETAENRISAARLWQLARALDVGVEYFFAGFSGPEASISGPARAGDHTDSGVRSQAAAA